MAGVRRLGTVDDREGRGLWSGEPLTGFTEESDGHPLTPVGNIHFGCSVEDESVERPG